METASTETAICPATFAQALTERGVETEEGGRNLAAVTPAA
jgi:hypothetical protein